MTFTQEAWARNSALFQATLEMPFNRELADGTLSIERFRHYMIQDAHYLVGFGRALAVAAGTIRRRLALLAACVTGQLLWVSWVWDLGSVSVHWVP